MKRSVGRILLVDDSELVLRAWTVACRGARRETAVAMNRAEALERARREQPDLVLVDLFLGEENGLDVVRDLRASSIAAVIIVVSAHLCVDYAMRAVHAGADDCFEKTVSIRQIIDRVEQGRAEPDWKSVPTLREVEWQHIARVLNDCNGNITHAAAVLGEHRQSLQRKIRRYAPGVLRLAPRTRRKLDEPTRQCGAMDD